MSDESTGEICVLMNLKLMGGQYLVDEDRIGVAEDGLLHLSAGRCRFDGLHGRYPSAVSQAARKGCSTVWGSMYSSTVVREQGHVEPEATQLQPPVVCTPSDTTEVQRAMADSSP